MSVKNRLRKIRLEMDITQEEIADLLGITQQQYNKYERQKNQPAAENMLRIAKKLKIPVEEIFYIVD
jgi:putative transcriptional regulator